MGAHPLNLALRFMLEIAALIIIGLWGWKQSDSWLKFLLAIGIPLILMTIWGIFNVPGDPSRSGQAPVIIPGFIRLLIELGIFSLASWCLYDMGPKNYGVAFAVVVLMHYAISYDRIIWLLKH